MKIGVAGCGAVGSFYGARLGLSGEEVHFLLRSDYETVSRDGLAVISPWGDFTFRPACAREPESIGVCDLVLIGLKTTANAHFERLLRPLAGPETVFLTLQNGRGNEEELARIFPPGNVMGGLCFVCLNRTAPGRIHHIDHGKIVLGEHHGPPRERTRETAGLLRNAGVPCEVTGDLGRSHWEKLAWNIPFNGLGVASAAGLEAVLAGAIGAGGATWPCLTTDRLLADPRWEGLVRELMEEVVRAAGALGYSIRPGLTEKLIERTRSMGPYKASTLVDFERGHPLELESLFLEPRRRAEAAGAKVPRLAALSDVLVALEAG